MTGSSVIFSASGKHLGKIYAQAVFSLAVEQNLIDEVKDDIESLINLSRQQNDLLFFLDSPYFNNEIKQRFIEKVFTNHFSDLAVKFLLIIIKNKRVGFLPVIVDQYSQLWFDHYNCCPVNAVVSEPFDNERILGISHRIEEAIGKKIALNVVVDPAILGGIIIRYQGNLIDNSVRTRLYNAIKTIKARCSQRGQIDEI